MKLTLNDSVVDVDPAWQGETLLVFLREALDLTGAKSGCAKGACGSCTVLVDGVPKLACKTVVKDVAGCTIVTIEGMAAADGTLHPLQQAFVDHGAIQCGFCTPGMVLRAHGLLLKKSRPTRVEIRKALSANLCRCTGYQQIIDAVEAASVHYSLPDAVRERSR